MFKQSDHNFVAQNAKILKSCEYHRHQLQSYHCPGNSINAGALFVKAKLSITLTLHGNVTCAFKAVCGIRTALKLQQSTKSKQTSKLYAQNLGHE